MSVNDSVCLDGHRYPDEWLDCFICGTSKEPKSLCSKHYIECWRDVRRFV